MTRVLQTRRLNLPRFLMSESALLELDTAAADSTKLFPGVDVEYEVLRDNWQACRPASEQGPAPEGQG